MQHRKIVAFLAALGGAALLASACDDGGDRHGRHHHHANASCGAELTCGTCTPVIGCGFCFTPDGGACVDDPDDCPSDATGFTWDPPGCDGEGGVEDAGDAGEEASDASEASDVVHVLAEAGLGSSDAAGD